MQIPCSRTQFIESWLCEMPVHVGEVDAEYTYDQLNDQIHDAQASGAPVKEVKPGVYKIVTDHLYYWMGTPNQVHVAVKLLPKPQSLVIHLTGKRPDLQGKPPYASDLYVAILDDNPRSLVISDAELSYAGMDVWATLLHMGHHITAYNMHAPGQNRRTISSLHDLEKFMMELSDDAVDWRFVLSKPGMQLWECIAVFNTCRYRELAGMEQP